MPDFSGSLQSVELDATLWLVPSIPLLASLVLALWGRPLGGSSTLGGAPTRRAVATVGWGAAAASLVVLVYAAARLAVLPPDSRVLLSSLASLVRIGSLEVTASFVLEPGTAALALAVALVGTGFAWRAGTDSKAEPLDLATRLAWILLAVGGSLTAVMADDVVLMLVGWSAIAVAVAVSARLSRFALARASFAGLCFLVAAGLLSWGLGGDWIGSGDYVPDFRARLVAVQPPGAKPRAHGDEREPTGFLSLTALPGARVRVGGVSLCAVSADGDPGGVGTPSRPCKRAARSPFVRIPVAAAFQDVTVETGPGSYDLSVERVRLVRGVETTLALTGPTLSPRLARDEMSLRDETGGYVLQAELSKRRLWGLPVLTLIGVLLALAALAKGGLAPFHRSERKHELSPLAVSALGIAAAAAALYRFGFVWSLSPVASSVLGVAAGVAALWMAARAAYAASVSVALHAAAAAQLAIALIGMSAGAASVGVLHVAVVSLGVGALALLAQDLGEDDLKRAAKRGDPKLARAAQVAAAVATGAPLPLVGSVWARDAMGRAVFATEGAPLPGWVPFTLLMLSAALSAFAVWRVVLIVWGGSAPDQQKKTAKAGPMSSLAMALGGVGGALGLLAISGPVVGGRAPLLGTLFAQDTAPLPEGVNFALTGAAMACALLGWFFARQRYGSDWEKSEARRPLHALLSGEAWSPAPLASLADAAGGAAVSLVEIGGGVSDVPGGEPEASSPPAEEPAVESVESPVQSVKRPKKKKKTKKRGKS